MSKTEDNSEPVAAGIGTNDDEEFADYDLPKNVQESQEADIKMVKL